MQDYREKLQKLLNKLLREGRCWCDPFWDQSIVKASVRYGIPAVTLTSKDLVNRTYSFRDLVSMESQLRQFVCKKNMISSKEAFGKCFAIVNDMQLEPNMYQYWLAKSSLVEEKKLAKFLLDNIKL